MSFTSGSINNVCTKHRKIAFANPTIKNAATGFYIMISHVTGIILHIVHHLGTEMRRNRIYIIIIISGRLALQYITVIKQNKIIFVSLTLLLHQCINTRQTSSPFFLGNEIIGIIITMYITGLYNFQFHLTLLCRQRQHKA